MDSRKKDNAKNGENRVEFINIMPKVSIPSCLTDDDTKDMDYVIKERKGEDHESRND